MQRRLEAAEERSWEEVEQAPGDVAAAAAVEVAVVAAVPY